MTDNICETAKNSKALFLDLDGTLLDDRKKISERNRLAIDRMLAMGHRVIITTGRPLVSARVQAKALGLTGSGCYLIAYNGGVLFDTEHEKVIYKQTIPLPLIRLVFDEANKRGLHIQTYDDDYVLAEPRCDNEYLRYYSTNFGVPSRIIDSVRSLTQEPVKMLMIDMEDPSRLESMRGWVAEHAGEQLDTFFSSEVFVEIISKGLNKGNALRQMAALLDIPLENTISAGDAGNDLPMIRAAHLGCAMANASDAVKAAAGYITEADNNHDGVAEIIEKFIL